MVRRLFDGGQDMKSKEIRAYLSEVRAAPGANGGLRFTGYAAKFDTWSRDLGGFRERIAPGAFRDAIGRDDVRVLVNHNPNMVLGRTKSGTAKLEEDNTGLRFDVEAPDTSWARDLKVSVDRGDVDQCSFAFAVEEDGDEWHWAQPNSGELDERTLKKVKLFDVSIVTFPAYEDTEASSRSALDEARAEREKALAEERARKIGMLRKRLDLKEREIK